MIVENRLRAEQVAALFQHVTLGVCGAACAALVLVIAMIDIGVLDWSVGAVWTSYIWACAVAHLWLRRNYLREKPDSDRWQSWAMWFTAISLAEGIGWGWASIGLAGSTDRFSLEMLILIVALGIAAGAIPAFSAYLPAFFVLFLPTTIPCLLWSFSARHAFPEAKIMLPLMLLYIVAMGALGVRANRSFKELVGLRIRTSELAEDLRQQKDFAERANQAKSSFLAAASHDLRQPVHALGLFIGALRGTALPPDARRLVEKIESSAVAMDSLFSAILDISRLDAGVVDVNHQAFFIQPLLDRICNDHAAEAQEKSLTLVQHRCGAVVRSDPHLIERIVRNLVANAVRYTAEGRIVVGCRRQPGAISVEIWDTGPGIAKIDRDRIFEEYVQLDNPERDRAKGLGLGLAIVRRLSNLLGCKVTLRSRPGHGSCFSISLPLAAAPGPAHRRVERIPDDPGRALIIVIDDETAIQDAMQSLLTGWGYDVIVAGSGAEMLVKLAQCPVKPDVIICDYRLRADENGIDVVRQLQAECNEAIPAMLITGDTAAERLVEAQASELLLLHKPVPNSKLRAAIVHLIATANHAQAIS